MPPTPVWQPLTMLPQIAQMIDDAASGAAELLGMLG
jgi:hypothetical protein